MCACCALTPAITATRLHPRRRARHRRLGVPPRAVCRQRRGGRQAAHTPLVRALPLPPRLGVLLCGRAKRQRLVRQGLGGRRAARMRVPAGRGIAGCCLLPSAFCSPPIARLPVPGRLPSPLPPGAGTRCVMCWQSSLAGSPSWRHTCIAWYRSTRSCAADCWLLAPALCSLLALARPAAVRVVKASMPPMQPAYIEP